ncbi:CGNR zinc finger domain-containing protein [Leucobacter celer]|jgi:predicted RNA-binding Zn ribbon-like protein|uniref:CGNR zinc finger domain-containing protein n=1 Tax=Leucobacter celer TaxID=668625 RepID=UPI0006A7EE32|nr:CGNR zinc finger domain-containing protein [Leucobacter celer]
MGVIDHRDVSASHDSIAAFTANRAATQRSDLPSWIAKELDSVFISDQVSLSFCATMFAWDAPVRTDRLYSAERLNEWLRLTGIPELTRDPTAAEFLMLAELREAIRELTLERIAGADRPSSHHRAVLNSAAGMRRPHTSLHHDGFEPERPEEFDALSLLPLLAQDAVEVLTETPAERLKRCEMDPCSHLFVDRSRPGNRRWCTSQRCGGKARAAEFRARRTASALTPS